MFNQNAFQYIFILLSNRTCSILHTLTRIRGLDVPNVCLLYCADYISIPSAISWYFLQKVLISWGATWNGWHRVCKGTFVQIEPEMYWIFLLKMEECFLEILQSPYEAVSNYFCPVTASKSDAGWHLIFFFIYLSVLPPSLLQTFSRNLSTRSS